MTEAIHTVLTIFVLMGLGMQLTHIGWIDETVSKFLSKFVIRVALPGTIVQYMFANFTSPSALTGLAAGLIPPVLALLIGILLSRALIKPLGIPENRRGGFTVMFTFSNSVFIGLPVCNAIYGEASAAYTLTYYIANTVLFWTLGYAFMRRDGGGQSEKLSARDIITKVIPLPLVFLAASIILILCGVKLPAFVKSSAKYIGGTVTPLSLLYIGCCLMNMIKKRQLSWRRGYAAIIFGKFIIIPALVIAFIKLMSLNPALDAQLPKVLRQVLIMEAAMPIMTQTTIVESSCGGDAEYTAGATALSTLLSFAVIPLYTYLIDLFI